MRHIMFGKRRERREGCGHLTEFLFFLLLLLLLPSFVFYVKEQRKIKLQGRYVDG